MGAIINGNDIYVGGGGGGSGGEGTLNYEELNNLPSMEGVELIGELTLSDIGSKKQIRISWADYQALSTEEQNDESIVYYIYDYPNNVVNASNISYDNVTSLLSSTNVQDVIDELKVAVDDKLPINASVLTYRSNQIDEDDWALAQEGIWGTKTANDTYNIPAWSVIYKPLPDSFKGAYVNCYISDDRKGIYTWDSTTSTFVRLPIQDEVDALNTSVSNLNTDLTTLETTVSKMSEDVGIVTSSSALNNYASSRNLKGIYQDSSGIQYFFLQITTSVYSIQLLFMNDASTAVRDKVAFRIATGSTFGSTKWSWLSTSSIT